jgi:hypothetical protein
VKPKRVAAEPYRHKDCGGVLIPDIMGEMKLLAPPLYRHCCSRCGAQKWMCLKAEAPFTPEFVEKKPT